MAAARRPDIGAMIRRSGDAAGRRPEDVLGVPPGAPETPQGGAGQDGVGQGAEPPAPAPEPVQRAVVPAEVHRPLIAMDVENPPPQLVSFTARIDPELRAAMRQFAELQRYDVQKLVGILIEAGLIVQFGADWREQLNQQAPLWRSLKL